MTLVAFDFRKPPPGDLGRHASTWLAAACRRAAVPLGKLLPYPVSLSVGNVEVVAAAAAVAALPEDATALPVVPADPADGVGLLVFRRPVLIALLAGLVGEVPPALPEDREPTTVELSLVGYFAREILLEPLEKAWPAPDAPAFTAGGPTPPRLAWPGGPADLTLFATLTAATPFGDQPVYLVFPRNGLGERLAAADARPVTAPPPPSAHIEALVREMAVDLTVLLGTADLSMREVGGLRAGDVVVLRQKVDQPLDGLLSGARKFRVWPGTVGDRAAVVIDAPADGD